MEHCEKCKQDMKMKGFPCPSVRCCTVCYDLDKLSLANAFNEVVLRKTLRQMWKHMEDAHGYPKVAKARKGNGTHNGLWAFTLTCSPNDGYTDQDLLAAARKVMSQQTNPVKRFAWYLEYKEEGRHPHIHGIYETDTGGRIEAKQFKRAWPVWNESKRLGQGHRGGYHRPVSDEHDYRCYIGKDAGVSESKGFT